MRLISAIHQNLAECVKSGRFRRDLYYRLDVIELKLPPLRERLDDIGLLVSAILARLSVFSAQSEHANLSPAALAALRAYTFPGNVRELENILERALAFANDGLIDVADLGLKGAASATSAEALRFDEDEIDALVGASAPTVTAVMAAPETAIASAVMRSAGLELLPSLPDYLDDIERDVIRQALARTHFNRTKAADVLGISFRQLRYRMQRLSLYEQD